MTKIINEASLGVIVVPITKNHNHYIFFQQQNLLRALKFYYSCFVLESPYTNGLLLGYTLENVLKFLQTGEDEETGEWKKVPSQIPEEEMKRQENIISSLDNLVVKINEKKIDLKLDSSRDFVDLKPFNKIKQIRLGVKLKIKPVVIYPETKSYGGIRFDFV